MPHKSDKDKRFNLWEVAFLKFCSHPNIVKYIASYNTEKEQEIWVKIIVTSHS
jgi:hypothetical protein